jgi:carbon storage regulator
MLVLTRRVGEEIVIDGNIRITIVAIKGSQVRVGIAAPPSVPIFRQELVGCKDTVVGETIGADPNLFAQS